MKPLSDQISCGQSFMHAQKTAHDQFGSVTDRQPFGDSYKTFLRPLRPLCDCHFFLLQSDRFAVASMCDRGLS